MSTRLSRKLVALGLSMYAHVHALTIASRPWASPTVLPEVLCGSLRSVSHAYRFSGATSALPVILRSTCRSFPSEQSLLLLRILMIPGFLILVTTAPTPFLPVAAYLSVGWKFSFQQTVNTCGLSNYIYPMDLDISFYFGTFKIICAKSKNNLFSMFDINVKYHPIIFFFGLGFIITIFLWIIS